MPKKEKNNDVEIVKENYNKNAQLVMCTPKVRHFWRCIFYGKKRAKAKEV